MVKGSTFYVKHQTNPSITLSGYSGRYEVLDGNRSVVKSGAMVQSTDYFETIFQTSDMNLGIYRVVGFITFPDGFNQSVLDETLQII